MSKFICAVCEQSLLTNRDIVEPMVCLNCWQDYPKLIGKYVKLEQENKMMQECLEIIKEDKYEATPWLTVETSSAKKAKECLAKLTEGEK